MEKIKYVILKQKEFNTDFTVLTTILTELVVVHRNALI